MTANRRLGGQARICNGEVVPTSGRRKVAEGKDPMLSFKRVRAWVVPVAMLACLHLTGAVAAAGSKSGKGPGNGKLDQLLADRVDSHDGKGKANGRSQVIIVVNPGADLTKPIRGLGGVLLRSLPLIDGVVAELPNGQLRKLAEHPDIVSIHLDRPTSAHMNRVSVAVGARTAQSQYGYDGAGVGVAVVDSGVTPWHDDLTVSSPSAFTRA